MAYRPPCPAIFCLSAALMISHHTGVLAQGRVDLEGGGRDRVLSNSAITALPQLPDALLDGERNEEHRTRAGALRRVHVPSSRQSSMATVLLGVRPLHLPATVSIDCRFLLFFRSVVFASLAPFLFHPPPTAAVAACRVCRRCNSARAPIGGPGRRAMAWVLGYKTKGEGGGIPRSSLSSPCPLSDRS